MTEKVKEEWFFWRLVMAKVCTLEEGERYWSIDDAADAHEILDAQDACERRQMEKANRKK